MAPPTTARLKPLLLTTAAWLGALAGLAERPPPEARGFPDIRSFTTREYQGHNQIWTIAQCPDGIMYFGANEEIITYDGITWGKIPVPGSAFLRAMAIDDDGTLWVGGVNEFGRVVTGPEGQSVFASLRPHLPEGITKLGDVRRVHIMPDGVYFQSDAYLLRWADEAFSVWEMHERYVTLSVRWQDRVIVCREAGWVMPTEPDAWEPFTAEPDPSTFMLLTDIAPTGDGRWWGAAGRHGLVRIDETSTAPVEGEVADFLKQGRLYGVARLPDGRLVFPSLGNGVLLTDAELRPLYHLTVENGLPSNTVITATVTSPGTVWLGTEQGIVRLDLSPGFDRFSPANGLDANGANNVVRIDGQPLFATTVGPVEWVDTEGTVTNPEFQTRFEIDDKLNVIEPLPDGSLLIGGLRSMWWVDRDRQVHQLHSPSNISAITTLPRFPDHVFALHLTGIAIWRRDGDEWTQHRPLEGVKGEFQTLCTDDAGDLWFGSSNAGVGRLPYGDIAPGTDLFTAPDPAPISYTQSDGLPPTHNRFTVRDIDGAPLIMSSFGLYRFDRNQNRFTPETGYGDAFADGTWQSHYAAESPLGGVWFEARSALPADERAFRQIGKSINGEWRPLPVPNLEMVGALDEIACEVIGGEEILWLAGRTGVIRINVTQTLAHPPAPIGDTVIHHLATTAGEVLPWQSGEALEIPAQQNSVRFHFGTPGLAGELSAEHRSRLIGFVDGQFESNPAGERTFTNLPPGTYTFQASSRTADHRWSTPAEVTFAILAPWWLTPFAKFIYLVAGLAAVYAIVRWRTARLMRQRAELEALVAERTAELAQKAASLERLHELERDETLAARLAAETARLELLRYQLNPHFLFNSLNSIRALVYSAPDSAGEMVSKLADFCRRTLSRGGDEMVSVGDELEMARNYLDIEQVRWQDGLQIDMDIAEASLACKLPQNLLLPLLENAIKYGGRTSPDILRVRIATTIKDGVLTCAIANTGRWVKPDTNPFTDSTQIGLQNLRQRLRRHYGDRAELSHDDSEPGWVTVRASLPCTPPST